MFFIGILTIGLVVPRSEQINRFTFLAFVF